MINESLADATKCKHFETILSLTRMLSKKSWLTLTQDDIDGLISNVMRTYSYNGKETNTTFTVYYLIHDKMEKRLLIKLDRCNFQMLQK